MADLNTHTHTHLDVRQNGARPRPVEEPAPTMLGEGLAKGVPVWTVQTGANGMKHSRKSEDMVPYERPITDPAPTLDGKVGGAWKVAPEGEHIEAPQRWKYRNGNRANVGVRDQDEPAPTVLFGHSSNKVEWVAERPATSVNGDPRINPPGHKVNSDDLAAGRDGYNGRDGKNAVRVSVSEAAILQSFPPDHPWQGSRTSQFRQIGNAVPPGLAKPVLAALLDLTRWGRNA